MPPSKAESGHSTEKKAALDKRTYFKQADFPQSTLQQAQKLASALVDNFAGKEVHHRTLLSRSAQVQLAALGVTWRVVRSPTV
jgi:hypothetical protein